jgi:hypothetical protein
MLKKMKGVASVDKMISKGGGPSSVVLVAHIATA